MATINKNELRKQLEHRQRLSILRIGKPKYDKYKQYKNNNLAQCFLQDYSMFKRHLDTFDKDQCFKLITSNVLYRYKNKENCIILFDSFTISLINVDNNFFTHIIAEYMLK